MLAGRSRSIIIAIVALHAVAACSHSAARTHAPRAPAAPPRAARELPRLDAARLRYALRVARVALARWPWATGAADRACIQVVSEHDEWLLRCAGHAPPPFRAVAQRFDGQPVYASTHPVTFYGRTIPYAQISLPLVATVAQYDARIPGSKMYRPRPWFIVQSLDALVENHPAFGSATRTEAWLAIFVHELFHLPQLQQPAVRAFIAAHHVAWRRNPGARLRRLFAERTGYAAAIRAEFAPLAAAVARRAALSASDARATLRRWLAAHRARQQRFAARVGWKDLALWEDFEMFIEGLARLAENSFIIDPARHPGAAAVLHDDPRYHAFTGLEHALYLYPKYGKMRAATWFYELGAHIARLLDRAAGAAWRRTVVSRPGFLVGEVAAAVNVVSE